MIKCQCEYCLHLLGLPDNMGERKIMCPMCSDPLVIPKQSLSPKHLKPLDLVGSIPKYSLNDWDRAFAIELQKRPGCVDAILYKALTSFMKASKREDISLGNFLKRENIIPREELETIRKLIKGAVVTTETVFVECPNCFAHIDSKSRACKFCGQAIGDAAKTSLCPNCKTENEKGVRICKSCSADMRTGLVGNERRCAGCDHVIKGDPDKCPQCKMILKTRDDKRFARDTMEKKRAKTVKLVIAACVAALILLMVVWTPVRNVLHAVSVGSEQAGLELRLDDFRDTLLSGDESAVKGFLLPGIGLREGESVVPYIFTGEKVDGDITSVKKIDFDSLVLSDKKDSASVKASVKVAIKPRGNDEGILSGRVFYDIKETTVDWKWVMKDGKWFFASPLPVVETIKDRDDK